MSIFLLVVVLGWCMLVPLHTARAVPPPDFIFNIGSQIVQIFTFLVLAFSISVGVLRRFFQTSVIFTKYRTITWIVLALLVIGASLAGAYYYNKYKQEKDYNQWVQESKQQSSGQDENQQSAAGIDQLQLGHLQPENINPRGKEPEDAGAQFIRTYYKNLGSGNIAAAYAVSSKPVPFETYQSWYKDTTGVTVDSLQKISDNNYSLGLTLIDKTGTTRYAVLMKLKQDSAGNYQIEHSDVRVLAQTGTAQPSNPVISGAQEQADNGFYEQNKNSDLSISNEDFRAVTDSQPDAYILDAREDEEYEIGYFPGSHHIRFADIQAGEWISLPQDRVIYVLCWSGIRGREVAEFLRTKNIVARFLDKGADGWVAFGGRWNGGIKFLGKYTDERYQIVFGTDEVKKYVKQGVVLVDSRHPDKYRKRHMPGSVSIPVIYTPTSQMDQVLSQVPTGSTVITICDDFVSCFDAKVAGVKLEKKGNTFLGRYNKPWEYFQ